MASPLGHIAHLGFLIFFIVQVIKPTCCLLSLSFTSASLSLSLLVLPLGQDER